MALPPNRELVFCITYHKSIHAGYNDEWCIWLRVDGNRFEYYGTSTKGMVDAKAKATRIATKGKRVCSFISEDEMRRDRRVKAVIHPPKLGYCKHGTYVGGMGIDYMCHWCEMGE